MALGGVAIGSINAQLLAMVTGISKYKMGISILGRYPPQQGLKQQPKPHYLLIGSVMKSISKINKVAVRKTFKLAAEILSVISDTMPVNDIPFANANPPPKRIKMPQSLKCSPHSNRKTPSLKLNGMATATVHPLIIASDNPTEEKVN